MQTCAVRHIHAPRTAVYRALTDPAVVAVWRVPNGMTAVVHSFDARVGGEFRISLTYLSPNGRGKTAHQTDTYHGRFIELVPNKRVVEKLQFETSDPALRGVMTMTTTLADARGGTDVVVMHRGIPPGVSAADNEIGTKMALDKLAALLEPQ
ncbi:MAG: SRPBCC family protein [Mycobacterium sp.]|nr:SRPBCC family protein [Mycobacterium sp.]